MFTRLKYRLRLWLAGFVSGPAIRHPPVWRCADRITVFAHRNPALALTLDPKSARVLGLKLLAVSGWAEEEANATTPDHAVILPPPQPMGGKTPFRIYESEPSTN